MRDYPYDMYTQIGIVTLIGLAAKNAILIVEYARMSHEEGMSIVDSALEAARLRLRPILMTSFAFILGVVPLALAVGAGAASRRSLGTAVFGGIERGHSAGGVHRARAVRGDPAGRRAGEVMKDAVTTRLRR